MYDFLKDAMREAHTRGEALGVPPTPEGRDPFWLVMVFSFIIGLFAAIGACVV